MYTGIFFHFSTGSGSGSGTRMSIGMNTWDPKKAHLGKR